MRLYQLHESKSTIFGSNLTVCLILYHGTLKNECVTKIVNIHSWSYSYCHSWRVLQHGNINNEETIKGLLKEDHLNIILSKKIKFYIS